MGALHDFLKRNTIQPEPVLPLVHSTRALHIKKIRSTNAILTSRCDVFNEDLNYFFVGRPAYKHSSHSRRAAYWELPACFIMEFKAITDIKRLFPFDSGAFSNSMMPEFIQIMDRDNFEVTGLADAPERVIGAFFGNAANYLGLNPKDTKEFQSEFGLGAFDEEIKALHMLATQNDNNVDDRRFCIELQSTNSVALNNGHLLAVVCPSIYLDNAEFRTQVELEWKAEPISYAMQPLNYSNYMAQIYSKIEDFYKQSGFIK